ncbi:MAG: ubiquitin-like small modifier protein 1, partial [Halobacteriota archaeon]
MRWRLFADLAEAADTREVTLDLGDGATVDDALEALCATHPSLHDRVLDDGRLADHLTVLRNGRNVETEADG